jgi:hypothetical protein
MIKTFSLPKGSKPLFTAFVNRSVFPQGALSISRNHRRSPQDIDHRSVGLLPEVLGSGPFSLPLSSSLLSDIILTGKFEERALHELEELKPLAHCQN